MDFNIPDHSSRGYLNYEDLSFFYYDIGLDNLAGLPNVYDWDAVMNQFAGVIDIDSCAEGQVPNEYQQNVIRFTLCAGDNGSKSSALFRHLRNAFSHYRINREGDNFTLTDQISGGLTMRGLINAELLKKICFKFFEQRDAILNNLEDIKEPK